MIYLVLSSVLLLCNCNVYASENCCDTGQVLLKVKDMCWDPKLNITSPYIMDCNATHRFRRGFDIMKDNSLNVTVKDHYVIFEDPLYCISNSTHRYDVGLKNVSTVLLLCKDDKTSEKYDDKVLGYCIIVSVLFLVPTAVIYAALPELRDIQGKSIINFCISSAIAQGILAIMKTMNYSNMDLCAIRGFLAYFFVIVSFLWTNSISIQLLLSIRRPTTLDYSWKEFKWYFIYSWGLPAILTASMAIVNFLPGSHTKPDIGKIHCWFRSAEQQWYYMYSIISLILIINICIFIYISSVLWRQSFQSSHAKMLKFKLSMTARLIVVMGLQWVFEIFESLTGEHIVWYVIGIFNCFQGLLIFLVLVVFRRRVVKLMYKRGWLKCISKHLEKYLEVVDDEEDNVVTDTNIPISLGERTRGE